MGALWKEQYRCFLQGARKIPQINQFQKWNFSNQNLIEVNKNDLEYLIQQKCFV